MALGELTMKVHDDFQPVGLRPRNSFCEVRKLPLNVRFPSRHVKSPVSDRQPYVIEPIGCVVSANTSVIYDIGMAMLTQQQQLLQNQTG